MAAMTDAALWDLTQRTFGDLGPGVVQGMFNIAKRESGGNPAVRNLNPATRDDSWGLWQINVRPDANPKYASWDLTDPEQNAKAARELYNAAGPTPWSTYNPQQDAAMFGGTSADYKPPAGSQAALSYDSSGGLSGATPGSRPLIGMSSVNGPAATKADATPAPRKPYGKPDWKLLEPILRQGGGLPAGMNPDTYAALGQTAPAEQPLVPMALPSTGGILGKPPPLESLIQPIPNAPVGDGSLPLVPIPNAPVMTAEEWKKKLVPLSGKAA